MDLRKEKIFVAGHRGMVGSSVVEQLYAEGVPEENLVKVSSKECDLKNEENVKSLFKQERPSVVILAAAKVGGIKANSNNPVQFFDDNLEIAQNVINNADRFVVKRLLNLGSSCIYPKSCQYPIKEESLLTGELEKTNEAYALAKISALKLCQFYRKQYGLLFYSLMPCNIYGPGDLYNLQDAHVLPALIRKFHEAKENNKSHVTIWGSGEPWREFLHVNDLARAIVFMLKVKNPPDWINVGSGQEIKIKEFANKISKIVGFNGEINFDTNMPDGVYRKLMDSSKIFKLGWRPQIDLDKGIELTYKSFLEELRNGTLRT